MNLIDVVNNTSEEEREKIKKEMISQVDVPVLKEIFEYTLKMSYQSKYKSNCKTSKLDSRAVYTYLKIWSEQKWPIFILLGKKIRYSFDTKIKLDDTFAEELEKLFKTVSIIRGRRAGNEGVVVSTRHFGLYRPVLDLFGFGTLKENICPSDEKYKKIIDSYIPGQKLSRFFSRFFDDENFDIEYSKLFQNNVKGMTGNISIDPVDFVTISYSSHYNGSCYDLESFYNAAGYCLMLGRNDIILFCTNKEKCEVRNIKGPILDKINRFCLYIDNHLDRLYFHSHIVNSSHQFVEKFVSEIQKLINKNLVEKVQYKRLIGSSSPITCRKYFHHCYDAPGEVFEATGKVLSSFDSIDPGYYELPRLSNVEELCIKNNALEGWII